MESIFNFLSNLGPSSHVHQTKMAQFILYWPSLLYHRLLVELLLWYGGVKLSSSSDSALFCGNAQTGET